ncbi:MAG: HlyD family efflux transporter periplasmic adaptor subunit [Cocleimonas sp.]|nr:HlyD family efflux transporter periplasmic adaptor subunit [Cocleimonas sp.]
MLRLLRILLKILLPIIAIVIAIAIAKFLMATSTKQERRSKPPSLQTVEAMTVKSQNYTVMIPSQGVVDAAKKGVLTAEVSGRISKVSPHFHKGGSFQKGDVLIQINPEDYQQDLIAVNVDLTQAKASIQEAQAAVQEAAATVEERQAGIKEALAAIQGAMAAVQEARSGVQTAQANTDLARHDWKTLGSQHKPSALALHLPALNSKKATFNAKKATLNSKKASLDSKKASLNSKKAFLKSKKALLASKKASLGAIKARIQQARTKLARTTILAPYAGRFLKKQVDNGQYVSTGMTLASIYALDAVEIRLSLTDLQASFIKLPERYQGEKQPIATTDVSVLINNLNRQRGHNKSVYRWQGKIVRTEGDIDVQSRQQFVIAKIDHPYKRQKDNRPSLKIGQFVQAEIKGVTLFDVIVLPRNIIRGKDEVLVISKQNTIERRPLDVLWRDEKIAVLRGGLKAGERISTTPLTFASNGMKVKIKGEMKKKRAEHKAPSTPISEGN